MDHARKIITRTVECGSGSIYALSAMLARSVVAFVYLYWP
jgi:hypothetical protein